MRINDSVAQVGLRCHRYRLSGEIRDNIMEAWAGP